MILEARFDGRDIGRIYDKQAESYARFANESYTWTYIEKPAFDHCISDLYNPDTQVLDLGCGEGRVVRHLISRGIKAENIVGTDVSGRLLDKARLTSPEARFLQGSLDEIQLPPASFDLITANMVFHHMDNETFENTLDRIYNLLRPTGQLFFVDTYPDRNLEGRRPENLDKWLKQKTPWGTQVPYFNRHSSYLMGLLDLHGFDYVSGLILKVSEEGIKDPTKYLHCSSHPSRMAARFEKTSEDTRVLRMSGGQITSLI